MPLPALTFDAKRLQQAIAQYQAQFELEGPKALEYASKSFVKNVIAFTPPSRGEVDSTAKTRGEGAVLRDVDLIFEGIDTRTWQAFYDEEGKLQIVPVSRGRNRRGASVVDFVHLLRREEMYAYHQKMRTRANGGVQRINRDNLIGRKKSDVSHTAFVSLQDLKWYNKEAIKTVGKLGAGWNKAAEKVGYTPPAWIKRHGSRYGDYVGPIITDDGFLIIVSNSVPFANAVRGISRTVQTALDKAAEGMENRIANAVERAAQKAGFK